MLLVVGRDQHGERFECRSEANRVECMQVSTRTLLYSLDLSVLLSFLPTRLCVPTRGGVCGGEEPCGECGGREGAVVCRGCR